MPVNPIPKGCHSINAHICVADTDAAIEFYTKAFNAKVTLQIPGPSGKPAHTELAIGNSILMIREENLEWGFKAPATIGGSPVTIALYIKDVDAVYKKAIAAGATGTMPPQDMFWGDRYSTLTDPFGHTWSIATHTEDLSPQQIQERMASTNCS